MLPDLTIAPIAFSTMLARPPCLVTRRGVGAAVGFAALPGNRRTTASRGSGRGDVRVRGAGRQQVDGVPHFGASENITVAPARTSRSVA